MESNWKYWYQNYKPTHSDSKDIRRKIIELAYYSGGGQYPGDYRWWNNEHIWLLSKH